MDAAAMQVDDSLRTRFMVIISIVDDD